MEEESIDSVMGEIHIQVTDKNVLWDSEMSFQEVYFWLGVTMEMMMNTFLSGGE